MFDLAD